MAYIGCVLRPVFLLAILGIVAYFGTYYEPEKSEHLEQPTPAGTGESNHGAINNFASAQTSGGEESTKTPCIDKTLKAFFIPASLFVTFWIIRCIFCAKNKKHKCCQKKNTDASEVKTELVEAKAELSEVKTEPAGQVETEPAGEVKTQPAVEVETEPAGEVKTAGENAEYQTVNVILDFGMWLFLTIALGLLLDLSIGFKCGKAANMDIILTPAEYNIYHFALYCVPLVAGQLMWSSRKLSLHDQESDIKILLTTALMYVCLYPASTVSLRSSHDMRNHENYNSYFSKTIVYQFVASLVGPAIFLLQQFTELKYEKMTDWSWWLGKIHMGFSFSLALASLITQCLLMYYYNGDFHTTISLGIASLAWIGYLFCLQQKTALPVQPYPKSNATENVKEEVVNSVSLSQLTAANQPTDLSDSRLNSGPAIKPFSHGSHGSSARLLE